MNPLLAVPDLVVRYGERQVVDGESITVGAGEAVGPSGCGTSTTTLAVLRPLRPPAPGRRASPGSS
ncbi:hypothetical protein ACFW6S_03365 [Streptomyces sp. NPDC058740]|uniref:hypothetical protein n=1 Tax=Streptomyces sp. NPDC058740 TaxID=3346619 RepID=UPI0036C2B442